MRHIPCSLALALVGGLCAPSAARAMDLGLTGSWSTSVSSSDLISGAGSELTTAYESSAGAIDLDVTLAADAGDVWRIEVRRADSTWDSSVKVWVRRTDGGTGDGSVVGGLTWMEVGPTDQLFFTGAGNRTGMSVQVRVDGLSLSVPPAAYLTTLQYTLVDTV